MKKSWFVQKGISRNCLLAASALALTVQLVPCVPGMAASSSKKASTMQIPIAEKLDDSNGEQPKSIAARADLSPLTLRSEQPAKAESGSASGAKEETLNATVTTNDFVPKGLGGKSNASSAPVSIKTEPGSLEEKVIKDARKTNLLPLTLMESKDELDKATEGRFEAEKVQLTDLWNATLTRSPDIQFVTQKLLPTSKPGHTTEVMMRFLSAAMFGGMAAANMMSPNMGMYACTGMGGSMIQQVLGVAQNNSAQKAKLSQTETIMLYNMVRSTADHLVENYRDYKKEMANLRIAEIDFSEMQNMVKDNPGQNAAEALQLNYTLRKAQRDINAITQDVRKHRQSLTDLAGQDAIAKLDKQMDEEQIALDPAVAAATKGLEQAAHDLSKPKVEATAAVDGKVMARDNTKPADGISVTR